MHPESSRCRLCSPFRLPSSGRYCPLPPASSCTNHILIMWHPCSAPNAKNYSVIDIISKMTNCLQREDSEKGGDISASAGMVCSKRSPVRFLPYRLLFHSMTSAGIGLVDRYGQEANALTSSIFPTAVSLCVDRPL